VRGRQDAATLQHVEDEADPAIFYSDAAGPDNALLAGELPVVAEVHAQHGAVGPPSAGLVCNVVAINSTTRSLSTVRGRPGRSSSFRPAIQPYIADGRTRPWD